MARESPEANRRYQRKYRAANREKVHEYMRKYRAVNREARLEYMRAWREANRERLLDAGRAWYAANREKVHEYMRKYREANREAGRKYWRKSKYNLTHEQFEVMRLEQNNRCAICGAEFDDTVRKLTPHVDHDHDTGKVRSLLCRRCNLLIGHADDSPERCVQAANYLRLYGR